MHSNCTRNLLDLKDVYIKKVVHADHYVKIFIETAPSFHTCPDWGNQTKRIHDYRYQEIKDLPFQMKHTYLVLKKRCYVCQCGKRFTEKYDFLPSYQQRTIRLSYKIIDLLRNLINIKSVADITNVSVNTVTRLLDTVNYSVPSLPECISIDEFKGDTDAGKYQCILLDAKRDSILDILPDRTQSHLSAFLKKQADQSVTV